MIFVFFVFFSFLLEHAFSMCISLSSFFQPFFSLTALVMLSPYFLNRKKEYFLIAFFLGFFYDITYTNSLFLNAFLFLALAFFLTFSKRFFQNQFFFSLLTLFFSICFYQVVTFFLLFVIGYLPFDLVHLFMGIVHSILANLIYGMILFFVFDRIYKRFYSFKG